MKRIIFTVTNDLTYDRRMLRIGTSLAKAGFEVVLVGRRLKTSQTFQNPYIIHKRFNLFFNKGKFFYLEYNIRLFFWLLFQRFDIVCGIDLDTIVPCFWASILRGGKICVYDAHELFTEVPEVTRRPAIRKIWLAIEQYIVPKIRHAYTVSQSITEEFKRRYNVDFQLIRNMPLRQNPQLKPFPDTPILLYQGDLNEGRGLETCVEAMQYLENAVLWIVGDGVLMPILRGLAKKYNIEEKVKFWGYVTPDKLPDITETATIGLHVSEDKGLSYQYSLGNKFLDYIQAGVPQICTQFIEYQRFNTQYNIAILIPKTDVKAIVESVNHLTTDREYYKKLQQNCLKAASELCWEEEEKKLIAFYKNL